MGDGLCRAAVADDPTQAFDDNAATSLDDAATGFDDATTGFDAECTLIGETAVALAATAWLLVVTLLLPRPLFPPRFKGTGAPSVWPSSEASVKAAQIVAARGRLRNMIGRLVVGVE